MRNDSDVTLTWAGFMHQLRGSMTTACAVCGVDAGKPCSAATFRAMRDAEPLTDEQLQANDLPALLEWQILAGVHHLRRINADHWLVRAVQGALPAIRDPLTFDMFKD